MALLTLSRIGRVSAVVGWRCQLDSQRIAFLEVGVGFVCVALGVGAALYPMQVRLPKGFLIIFFLAPVVAGVAVLSANTPRWAGVLLLGEFAMSTVYLVRTSRKADFLAVSPEIEELEAHRLPLRNGNVLTALGIILITLAGEMVAQGRLHRCVLRSLGRRHGCRRDSCCD